MSLRRCCGYLQAAHLREASSGGPGRGDDEGWGCDEDEGWGYSYTIQYDTVRYSTIQYDTVRYSYTGDTVIRLGAQRSTSQGATAWAGRHPSARLAAVHSVDAPGLPQCTVLMLQACHSAQYTVLMLQVQSGGTGHDPLWAQAMTHSGHRP